MDRYLKVTTICRYIFLRFWPKHFELHDLYAEMVQGRQILMFNTILAFVGGCGYIQIFCVFEPVRKKILSINIHKNSHLTEHAVY